MSGWLSEGPGGETEDLRRSMPTLAAVRACPSYLSSRDFRINGEVQWYRSSERKRARSRCEIRLAIPTPSLSKLERGRVHLDTSIRPRPPDDATTRNMRSIAAPLRSRRLHTSARAHKGVLEFKEGVMLSKHSTWGIGGPARWFVEVFTKEEMLEVHKRSIEQGIPLFVLGRGSNCLFDDRGYDGVVVLNSISKLEDLGEGRFRVGSGFRFDHLGVKASKDGWSGLEFAAGIPGTVGGAVYMNAGSNNQQTSDVLVEVEYLDSRGNLHMLVKENEEFDYRKSPFQVMQQPVVVVSALFQLERSDLSRSRVMEYMDRRRQTQPLLEKSAGCVFRNPGQGQPSVGYLIEHLGMKGLAIGGASVSQVHGNFLINADDCKCCDMLQLIQEIKARIKEATGIDIEEEICYVPPNGHRNH